MKKTNLWSADLNILLYPKPCILCRNKQAPRGEAVCLSCSVKLPHTRHHLNPQNEFTERFWGRVPLLFGAAAYFFTKKGLAQKLIHQFKYKNQRDIGLFVGRSYGFKLIQSEIFNTVDLIVPVPLHPLKQRKRGYNQSTIFAQGISETTGIPVFKDIMRRVSNTKTQTQKGNIERLLNVENIFEIKDFKSIADKHILIVDDVLTTGATLESCAQPLLDSEGTKISMVTMAMAMM